jgi:hypothetical protein
MMDLKLVYPTVDNLLFNDSILFLVADTKVFNVNVKMGQNYSAIVVPRSDLTDYRTVFLQTYRASKYRHSTLYHFKILYRYKLYNSKGGQLNFNWDLEMDKHLLKRTNVSDLDRKILMPSRWVDAANFCRRAIKNSELLQSEPASDYSFNFN